MLRSRSCLVAVAGVALTILFAPTRALAQDDPAQARPAAPDPSAVTPPVLKQFVNAKYPEQAQAKQLEADVVLRLDIDETGTVTHVEVTEPAGNGFDEAAIEAAKRFVFEPARRGDVPVPSRILYRYSFHFTPVPKDEAKLAAPSSIRGSVRASGGDAALAGASITITRAGKALATLTTDVNGAFQLDDLAPGAYEIAVEAPGFTGMRQTEHLGESEQISVVYRLIPKTDDDALTITVVGERPPREVTRRNLSRREMSRVPGTSGDALRSLENMPGVARAPALSGLLVVRGTEPTATPVLVEGMFLPNIYHFGGLSSVIPTELLEDIDFYPGNFSVRYGRALGGVVNAGLRQTRNDGEYHGLLQVDLIDARAMLEGPIPGTKSWNVIGGIRRSHVDLWLTPLLENEDTDIAAAPVYYDYQLLADTHPTPKSYLRLGLIGFDDRLRLISTNNAMGC
jgi:TonB family protein